MHESSEEFAVQRDSTTDCGVSCPLASAVFDRIIFILAGNGKSLDESEIRPD